MINKKNIIITGESGLLGSTLKITLGQEYNIVPFEFDITDFKADEFGRYKNKIDFIIHTAAITNVKQCETDRGLCEAVNVAGTRNMVNLAKYLNSKLIYISTVSVFSGETGGYREADAPAPKSYYDLSKYQGEQIVGEYEKGMTVRLNLIGLHPKGSRGKNFLEWLYDSVRANKDMTLFDDVVINPLSSWSLAEIIKKIIAEKIEFKILHLGSADLLSKAEIGKMIIEKIGGYKGAAKIESIDKNSTVFRPKKMWLDISLAEKKLNLKMPRLEAEIDKILKMNKTYGQPENK